MIRASLLLTLLVCLTVPSRAGDVVLIRADRVLTAAGPAIEDASVVVRDGRIVEVGARVGVREGEPGVRSLRVRGVVAPGLIDCGSDLGIEGRAAEEASEITPGHRVLDSVDLDHPGFRRALEAGVTTVAVSAGARNVIGGLGAVIRRGTGAARLEDVVLRRDAFLDVSLVEDAASGNSAPRGSPPLNIYFRIPNTRMGTVFLVRRSFGAALGLTGRSDAQPRGDLESRVDPAVDALGALTRLDALAAALRGEIPLRIRADYRQEVETAFRLLDEFGASASIVGAAESRDLLDELIRRRAAVFLRPGADAREREPESFPHYCLKLPAILAGAGVPFGFASENGTEVPLLRERVALRLRYGLDEETALEALTLGAARLLGIDGKTGSIERGKDADIVAFDRDPLDVRARVLWTMVAGTIVWPPEERTF